MKMLLPVLLVLASCVSPTRKPNPGPGPEVIAAVELMYDDLSSRRWDQLEAHFLPEAALVFSTETGPRRMTPVQFIEMVKKNVEGKDVFEERMTDGAAVWAHGNMATVWSPFEGREGKGTEVRTWSGIDSFTLIKVDGRWKIAFVADSQNPKP